MRLRQIPLSGHTHTNRQELAGPKFHVQFHLLCFSVQALQFSPYDWKLRWDPEFSKVPHWKEIVFHQKMLPFSTLKESVADILNTTCVFPFPPSIITGTHLFFGKILYLIGMTQMLSVIVPVCLTKPKKALL